MPEQTTKAAPPAAAASAPAESRTVVKADPFKPAQPNIPGVPRKNDKARKGLSEDTRTLIVVVGGLGGMFLISVMILLVFSHSAQRDASPVVAAAAARVAPADLGPRADAVPVGPGQIGTTEELSKAWAAKRFDFMNPMTHVTSQAEVVHLPNGSYWGFLLTEPFGDCRLEYVTDLSKLQSVYGFRADHPMVGDPCTHTVFDLLKYGSGTEGLVRGDIVQGSALRPPIAIEIKVQEHKVMAVRSE